MLFVEVDVLLRGYAKGKLSCATVIGNGEIPSVYDVHANKYSCADEPSACDSNSAEGHVIGEVKVYEERFLRSHAADATYLSYPGRH